MPHTPGPWKFKQYIDAESFPGSYSLLGGYWTTDKQGRPICDTPVIEPIDGDGEAWLNVKPEDAALVELAPDMFAILKAVEWSAGQASFGWHTSGTGRCPVCDYTNPRDLPNVPNGGHGPDCQLNAILNRVREAASTAAD